mmetsp:Transcript_122304/g.351371  ORF Transcript_122304/g.351371 Transcript_122304/m.351371 type:complete len:112 (+) Transcript_122304:68-403(+)|eukprot:CAMPEP_0170253312 /NCGR_PEP_ID=MMETSP0116_2-20130129/26495_1 /TAXON_ID=400756 /ORGANISM="Durinskia baltica, Strain CSIRO CS-38" /LENGTH=111 /DNA_ID=CAMNT_0010504293 /DNA_START=61 /DNA_END=396 /DNA_ORIENTATION=-
MAPGQAHIAAKLCRSASSLAGKMAPTLRHPTAGIWGACSWMRAHMAADGGTHRRVSAEQAIDVAVTVALGGICGVVVGVAHSAYASGFAGHRRETRRLCNVATATGEGVLV